MRTQYVTIGVACLATFLLTFSSASGRGHGKHSHCDDCRVIEEIVYEQQTDYQCKPEVEKKKKKKTVYCMKEVPVCEKCVRPLLHGGHGGECCHCEDCGDTYVRMKRVLIKKEVDGPEECKIKCVPEEIKVCVPVRRVRVVPCRTCRDSGCVPHIIETTPIEANELPSNALPSK